MEVEHGRRHHTIHRQLSAPVETIVGTVDTFYYNDNHDELVGRIP